MYRFVTALSVLLVALPALGQFDSGSDGTDGALDCAALFALNPDCGDLCNQPCTVQILLDSAATGPWNDTVHTPGVGVYDPGEWAVVYQYTTIDIPPLVTVTFVNHRKGAPVVWLVMDDVDIINDVNIAGTVELNGANGVSNASAAIPGPGGFSGGIGRLGGSAGFGPGGGEVGNNGGGGGYGTPGESSGGAGGVVYGRDSIDPLIGGSGGGAESSGSGGAGGGAILIASSGRILLLGDISANGGEGVNFCCGGSGSGGGIRLIANNISGSGMLKALGGTVGSDGGDGRIRLEAPNPNQDIQLGPTMPFFTEGPSPEFVFPVGAPSLRVAFIDDLEVPTDPQATVATGDVALTSGGSVQIDIEAENVTVPTTVTVRIVQADGGEAAVEMVELTGTFEMSTATAFFNFAAFDPGKWEVQLTVLLQSP